MQSDSHADKTATTNTSRDLICFIQEVTLYFVKQYPEDIDWGTLLKHIRMSLKVASATLYKSSFVNEKIGQLNYLYSEKSIDNLSVPDDFRNSIIKDRLNKKDFSSVIEKDDPLFMNMNELKQKGVNEIAYLWFEWHEDKDNNQAGILELICNDREKHFRNELFSAIRSTLTLLSCYSELITFESKSRKSNWERALSSGSRNSIKNRAKELLENTIKANDTLLDEVRASMIDAKLSLEIVPSRNKWESGKGKEKE